MRIVPLGGAEEIGASCTFIEIGGRRLVVDCGIRTGSSGSADPLPNLSALADLGDVDAILVTHAHLDHTGALPVLHQAFPSAPVYATPATHALIRVMLSDALKVMADRYDREHEVPLYSPEAVASLLTRAVLVPFVQPTPMFGGDVAMTFFPAGHVLGAAMIGLEAVDGSVLFTGDYSVSPQRTVEGLLAPRFKPDVLVTESTYGDRMHANRRVEERRLAETVGAIVEGGGKALIPAFALGRAQEVILILQQFQRDGTIPRFPVWVDGMVKNICGVYSSHNEALSRDLRQRLQREGKLFFREADGFAAVTPPKREEVAGGSACAIVSSSGMLTGGPSLFYARRLAADARSAILITGYQDEESPGRKLLDLAKARPDERKLVIEGQSVPVECRVEKYGLSAHADSGEMAGLAGRLRPKDVVLVHGAGEARARLAGMMSMADRVHLPSACDEMAFDRADHSRRTFAAPHVEGMGGGRPVDEAGLKALRAKLVDEGRGQALLTAEELAERWYGTHAAAAEVQQMRDVLALSSPHFRPDAKRPFLFRPSRPNAAEALAGPSGAPRSEAFPVDQTRALALATEMLANLPDYLRAGAYTEERRLVLFFKFPKVAAERHGAAVETLSKRTGWTVELHPEVQLALVTRAVEDVLPAAVRLLKAPSYFREQGLMKARVTKDAEGGRLLAEAARAFHERTGLQVEFEVVPADEPSSRTPLPTVARASTGGRLEINSAYAALESHLRGTGLLKRGLKQGPEGPFIELSFISPEVGARHQAAIDEAGAATGWTLRINPEPNQNAIKDRARALVPSEWGLLKEPSFLKSERMVRLKLAHPPTAEALAAMSNALEEATGYRAALVP